MVKKYFIGPLIHTNDRGNLIIEKHTAVVVEDGKVFNSHFIFLFYIYSLKQYGNKIKAF